MYRIAFFVLAGLLTITGCSVESSAKVLRGCGDVASSDSWGSVSDLFSDAEGTFSGDLAIWVRSEVTQGDAGVTLYYYLAGVYAPGDTNFVDSGPYTIDSNRVFSLQINLSYLGSSSRFYVESQGECYRGELPQTASEVPDKTLVRIQ